MVHRHHQRARMTLGQLRSASCPFAFTEQYICEQGPRTRRWKTDSQMFVQNRYTGVRVHQLDTGMPHCSVHLGRFGCLGDLIR
ncbi:hypothetical protein ACIQNU_25360 [Streptomyces sp. NPDC091292]|uniref:hypothetical protein n=1 Tax=Streptomyces sp. NPDC091292 TaxID=3365991 RepID=UPI003821BA92